MAKRRGWRALAVALALAGWLVGCTQSLEMKYNPALYRLPQADALKGIPLGVAKLEDRRASIERNDLQSLSYVMQAGSWKFGMTHGGKEYAPLADIVQSLFVEEFTRAGVETKAIPQILAKDAVPAMREAGEKAGVAWVLGGRILVFEVVNDVGMWTVDSRRSITLEINLVSVRRGDLVLDTTLSQSDKRNEGMGVRHTTNVDRLMNTAFRQIVVQVVEQVAAKLALDPRDIAVRVVWSRP
jgi:hypothetical protein